MRFLLSVLFGLQLLVFITPTAQGQGRLSGTTQVKVGPGYKGYTLIDWSVSYSLEDKGKAVYITFCNPRFTVASGAQYYTGGKLYSKSDLGISSWPAQDQTPLRWNFDLSVEVKSGGYTYSASPYIRKDCVSEMLTGGGLTSKPRVSGSSVSVKLAVFSGEGDWTLEDKIKAKQNGNAASGATSRSAPSGNNPSGSTTGTYTKNNNTSSSSTTNSNEALLKEYQDRLDKSRRDEADARQNFNNVLGNYIGNLAAEAAEERRRKQAAYEEKVRREKEIADMKKQRRVLFAAFPEGSVPLSSTKVDAHELYYFAYIFNQSDLYGDRPVLSVTNVFPIGRYGDGSWPFKSKIVPEIAKTAPRNTGTVTLVGYYASQEEAEQKRASFLENSKLLDFNLGVVIYKGKKSTGGGDNDFWENGSGQKPKPETKKPDTKKTDDFWNN